MWSKISFVSLLCAVGMFVLLLASRGSAMLNQADIVVVNETEEQLVMKFFDASGQPLTVTFIPVTRDEHTFWKPVSDLQQSRGIAFGNSSPTLPNTVRLRDRGIDPGTVVREFSPSIATETFDDLTVYQCYNGEIGVALHNNGLVTKIYYAGMYVSYSTPSVHPHPEGWLCDRWKEGCCRMKWVPFDEDKPNGPGELLPNPHLASCISAHEHCSVEHKTQACQCLKTACEADDEDINFNACQTYWDLNCGGGNPEGDDRVVGFITVMAELIALKE